MQHVENDMDDLFRKAVDNYTLQPGESKWDTITAELAEDDKPVPSQINHTKTTVKNVIALLLLLLIPLSTAMFSLYYTNKATTQSANIIINKANTSSQPAVNNHLIKEDKQHTIQYSANTPKSNIIKKTPFYHTELKNNKQANTPAELQINAAQNSNQQAASKYLKDSVAVSPELVKIVTGNEVNITKEEQHSFTPTARSLQKSHLYAGVIAGVTFNEVKNQGFKKPGFDAGIIAGYRINRNVAIEAGLLYSKKYYFSSGKYFSMDKMSGAMPADMKVLSLEGASNLYQLPVAFKYDVAHKKGTAFFVSAGVSSYILTKEKNDYQTSMNGVQQQMQGMYKNVSAGFASSIDMSAGYEHIIQKKASIRIQPYLQVPLKGIGMGSMQVLSTGIHVAYIR